LNKLSMPIEQLLTKNGIGEKSGISFEEITEAINNEKAIDILPV
jgi:hypothetical protein